MVQGWCETGEAGEGGGASWHNPTEIIIEGPRLIVIENDRRYANPQRSEFQIDRLVVDIWEKAQVLENGVETWGSLLLEDKGGSWLVRVLNTLLGKKEIKFEATERASIEKLCEEVGCLQS